MNSQTIGLALSARRQKLRIDKGQAADRIGMSRTTYSSYEQDRQRPSVDVFPALADFLEVSMEDFLLLYGATAIVAVRPALERVLVAQAVRMVDVKRDAETTYEHVEEHAAVSQLHSVPDENDEPYIENTGDSEAYEDDEVMGQEPEAIVSSLHNVSPMENYFEEPPKNKSKDKKKKKKSHKK